MLVFVQRRKRNREWISRQCIWAPLRKFQWWNGVLIGTRIEISVLIWLIEWGAVYILYVQILYASVQKPKPGKNFKPSTRGPSSIFHNPLFSRSGIVGHYEEQTSLWVTANTSGIHKLFRAEMSEGRKLWRAVKSTIQILQQSYFIDTSMVSLVCSALGLYLCNPVMRLRRWPRFFGSIRSNEYMWYNMSQ